MLTFSNSSNTMASRRTLSTFPTKRSPKQRQKICLATLSRIKETFPLDSHQDSRSSLHYLKVEASQKKEKRGKCRPKFGSLSTCSPQMKLNMRSWFQPGGKTLKRSGTRLSTIKTISWRFISSKSSTTWWRSSRSMRSEKSNGQPATISTTK